MARGDHIAVRRKAGYYHHGIDCGNGTVIHFSGELTRKKNASVRRDKMWEFLAGGKKRVVRHRNCLSADEVIERAESRLGERGYDLFANNCEHFAQWCKTGESDSQQVRKATVTAGATGGATVANALLPIALAGVVGASAPVVAGITVIAGLSSLMLGGLAPD